MTTTRTGDVDSFSFSVDFKIHQEFQDFCCRQHDALLAVKHDTHEREKKIEKLINENKSNYPNLAKQSKSYSRIIGEILDNQSKHKVVFDPHFFLPQANIVKIHFAYIHYLRSEEHTS